MKIEYDFLSWMSFPSSLKIIVDGVETHGGGGLKELTGAEERLTVVPGSKVKLEVKAKFQNVVARFDWNASHIALDGWDYDGKMVRIGEQLKLIDSGRGTTDWRSVATEVVIPPSIVAVRAYLVAGGGIANIPGITWFDDLKIYQDGVLIYSNDFSNWSPVIGAGVGAPIGGVAGYLLKEPLGPMVSEVVGAVVGGVLGGGIGLLTGLGIIPVPQIPIPALGAAPEGPGAPARLGKYQITG